MTKSYRQGQILKLIRSKGISTQEELAQELKSQGIAATQVTLSRDIRDLRLVKTREGYKEMAEEEKRLLYLREKLRKGIVGRLEEVSLNGHPTERLPGNLNLSFAYVEGEGLMMGMKDVAVSSGSACTSASLEPSYVLRALGRSDELAHSSIRFTVGRFTTEEEIDYTVDLVERKIAKLRELSPLWEMHKEGVDLDTVVWAQH